MTDRTTTALDIAAAIRAGCAAANIHLACSYPECNCKQIPSAVRTAVALVLAEHQHQEEEVMRLEIENEALLVELREAT